MGQQEAECRTCKEPSSGIDIQINDGFLVNILTSFNLDFQTFGYQQGYPGAELMGGSRGNQLIAISTTFPKENSMVLPMQANLQIPRVPAAPTLLGKG